MRDRSLLTWGSDLVACEFTFGLEPILQVTAGLFTALEINLVCATLDFLLACPVDHGTFFFPDSCGELLGFLTPTCLWPPWPLRPLRNDFYCHPSALQLSSRPALPRFSSASLYHLNPLSVGLFPDHLRPQIVPTFSEERGADAFRSRSKQPSRIQVLRRAG